MHIHKKDVILCYKEASFYVRFNTLKDTKIVFYLFKSSDISIFITHQERRKYTKLAHLNSFDNDKKDVSLTPWELVNFCEIDKFAAKSYCAIHGEDASKNLGDITQVNENDLPPFTMICGGSPCQDFSIAGKQKGSAWICKDCGHEYNPLTVHFSTRHKCPKCGSEQLDKTRSSLLVEWLRVIRANKPKWGIYENVKNIVNQFKPTFDMFIKELEEYGYNCYWKVLNAADYGIPQHRERLYLIIILKEYDNGMFSFPDPFESENVMGDTLEDDVDEKYYINTDGAHKLIEQLIIDGKLPESDVDGGAI